MKNSKNVITLLLILFLLFINCKNEGVFDPSLYHPTFKGITYSTEDGTVLLEDPEDWHLSTTSPYEDLFEPYEIVEIETPHSPSNLPASLQMDPPYPNPSSNSITFRYSLMNKATVLIFIIDSDRRIVAQLTEVDKLYGSGSYELEWGFKDIHGHRIPSNIYRCVYRLGHQMGYGDIWVE